MKAHLKWVGALVLGFGLTACPAAGGPPAAGGGGGNGGGTGDNGGGGTVVPAELQGEWRAGEASPIGYYDPNSGAWQGATGTSFILKLRPDGSYEYTGLMAVNTGTCQSKILSYEKGRVTIDGTKMSPQPHRGRRAVVRVQLHHQALPGEALRAPLGAQRGRLRQGSAVHGQPREQSAPHRLLPHGPARQDLPHDRHPRHRDRARGPRRVRHPGGRLLLRRQVVPQPRPQDPEGDGRGASGSFNFPALDDRPYFLQAILDANGNGSVDSGDLVDVYSTTDAPGPSRP
jgi:hypothetical protein